MDSSSTTTPTLAQLLLEVLQHSESFEAGLGLLDHLVKSASVTLADPVDTGNAVKPLRQALLDVIQPGQYLPEFYRETTVQRLLALDPTLFHYRQPDGAWWLLNHLDGWGQISDRQRYGFSSAHGGADGADHWLAAALASVPPEALAATDDTQLHVAWDNIIRTDLPRAAEAFARFEPLCWLRCHDNKLPVLRKSKVDWPWVAALQHGIDPHTPMPNGQPFWRSLLPAPSAPFVANDLRTAVERWCCAQIADPALAQNLSMIEYLKASVTARFERATASRSPKNQTHWIVARSHPKKSRWAEVDILDLPPQWASWSSQGVPVWALPLKHANINARAWVTALTREPSFRAHLDPLGQLVAWLFSANPPGPPTANPTKPEAWPDSSPPPGSAMACASEPAQELLKCLAPNWNLTAASLTAAIERAELEETTPASRRQRPSATRVASRRL